MTTPFEKAIGPITQVLRERTGAYTGVKPQEVYALGAAMSVSGQGHPDVLKELGFLASVMALDPQAFYEAADLALRRFRSQVAGARADLKKVLTQGPNSMLRWSPSSRGTAAELNIARILELQATIRKARFARTEVTDDVQEDLRLKAIAAAEELAELRRRPDVSAARLPDDSSLTALRETLLTVEQDVHTLLGVPEQWQEVPWREFAVRRFLEVFDADLQADVQVLGSPDPTAEDVDVTLAHIALGAEILERLLTAPTPFGQLLAPDVRLLRRRTTRELDIQLRPVPEVVLGRRSFPLRVFPLSSSAHTLETCIRQDGAWDHPTWFEQRVTLSSSPQAASGWTRLSEVTALDDILLTTAAAPLLRDDEDVRPENFVSAHAVQDTTIPQDYSLDYANGLHPPYNVLLQRTTGSGIPTAGGFVFWGDPAAGDQGYRFRVDAVNSTPVTFANIGGSFLEVQISDPLSELGATSIATYLQNAATNDDPPYLVRDIGTLEGLNANNFDLTTLTNNPATEPLFVAFHVDDPSGAYFGGIFGGDQDEQVSDLGIPGYPSHVIFQTPWDGAIPYADILWSAGMTLYRDSATHGTTNTLRIDVAWSPALKASLIAQLLTQQLRLVDLAGVASPVTLTVVTAQVYSQTLPAAKASFPASGDVVLLVSEDIDVSVSWALEMRLAFTPESTNVVAVDVAAQTPWRGWSDLAVDLAPGDVLYTQDGQSALVWGTSGNQARLVPGLSIPSGTLNALRVRHLRPGDRVVALSDVEAGQSAWLVTAIDYTGGITARPISGDAPGMSVGVEQFITPACATVNTLQTRRFEVVDPVGGGLVDLEDTEQRFRAQLAQTVTIAEGSVLPVRWYLRLAGRLQAAVVVGPSRVEVRSLSRPLPSVLLDAQFVVKVRGDGYDADLELVENWVDTEGGALGVFPAGGSRVWDIVQQSQNTVEAAELPAAPGTINVRTRYKVRGNLRGPLAVGGSRFWPPWALTLYRLERRILPNYVELARDIGRAKSTLGQPRQVLNPQTGLAVTLLEGRTVLQVTLLAPVPVASRLEGCDVVFSTGSETDPPIRVAEAEIATDGVTATLTLSRQVPQDNSGTVTLYEHALAQAWREVRQTDRYLAQLQDWTSYLPPQRDNRILQAANRLKALGFRRIADALIRLDFDRWVDPSWASNDGRALAEKVSALVDGLERRRPSPIEGGT